MAGKMYTFGEDHTLPKRAEQHIREFVDDILRAGIEPDTIRPQVEQITNEFLTKITDGGTLSPDAWLAIEKIVTEQLAKTPEWTEPELLNGWESYGGVYVTAAFRKLPHGVQLRGLIRNGTVGKPAFTIDAPPPAELVIPSIMWNGAAITACRISIKPNGDVIPATSAEQIGWVSLDGITIPTS